ncbi:PRC-barrel domain-containing protein [Romeria aff. gracilis LEGE 07310]|uniref:PRC-barrel domain-containing protein n=1 Tax=Vasconcelosia minhoensis LEGE 07310 TaxID=915328 RepID=A0A8J7A4Y1_9CYAN|nr:PRC-barrel domain-containing protein [Romeria gracilis]MBE9075985.1 PRC-barrel domain-containing protein [Romeria aff. gracilis LEGE 07310]
MNDADTIIRQSQLLGRLVMDYDTTEEVGQVEQLLVEVKSSQVKGLTCKSGFWGRSQQRFSWEQLKNIGHDGILVEGERDTPDLDAAQPMIGLEVWTDAGDRVGHLIDFCLDIRTGTVTRYLFAAERDTIEGVYGLSAAALISAGRKRIMVGAEAIEQAELYADGLDPATAQSEFDPTDWRSFAKGAQSLAEQLQAQTEKLSQQNLPELADQLREKTQQVKDQMQQRVSEAKDRLQSSSFQRPEPFSPKASKAKGNAKETIDIEAFEVWEDDEETS